MAKKIGDVFLGGVFLAFLAVAFSGLILDIDSTLGLDSGVVGTSLTDIGQSAQSHVNTTTTSFSENFVQSDYAQVESGSFVETRGADQQGLLARGSNNIFTGFFNSLAQYLPVPPIALILLMSLVSVVIGILALRFFWGESRV